MSNGQCGIHSSNVSKVAYRWDGIFMTGALGEFTVNFSTFEGINITAYAVLNHNNAKEGNYRDFLCNFVNNTQGSKDYGIVTMEVYTNVVIENCTIFGPYGNGKSISWGRYSTLKVINCNVDEYFSINYYEYGSKNIQTINLQNTSALNITPHISLSKCDYSPKIVTEQIIANDVCIVYFLVYALMLGIS